MGRAFVHLPDGVPFVNRLLEQIILAWTGAEGSGTDADLAGVPFTATAVKDDDLYAGDFRNRGLNGKHIRATHSTGSPVILDVTDAGIAFGAPTTGLFTVGMIQLWFGAAIDCPTGWHICDGTNGTPDLRDRFVIGAGGTRALSATGGAETADISHTHASAAHAHTSTAHTHASAAHSHSHDHDFAHTHSYHHDHDLSSHRHEYDHDHQWPHDHGGTTSGPSPSTFKVRDDTETVTISDPSHIHEIDNDTGTTDPPVNAYVDSPLNSNDGYTGPPVRGAGSGSTPHNTRDYTGDAETGGVTTPDWDLHNTSGGTGTQTDVSAVSTTPGATGSTTPGDVGSTTPGATGSSGSTTQSILPTFTALYYIMRIAA